MLVLLVIIALTRRNYVASVPVMRDVMDAHESVLLPAANLCIQNHKMRTHLDIIWSCVSTLFICTWVAIHPNIPLRGEGLLLVPEFVLIWVYRQWDATRYIAEYFKG